MIYDDGENATFEPGDERAGNRIEDILVALGEARTGRGATLSVVIREYLRGGALVHFRKGGYPIPEWP